MIVPTIAEVEELPSSVELNTGRDLMNRMLTHRPARWPTEPPIGDLFREDLRTIVEVSRFGRTPPEERSSSVSDWF